MSDVPACWSSLVVFLLVVLGVLLHLNSAWNIARVQSGRTPRADGRPGASQPLPPEPAWWRIAGPSVVDQRAVLAFKPKGSKESSDV